MLFLALAAILTTGRRTIANLLRTARHLSHGDASSYQRVLSQAHWSGLRLAALLARLLVCHPWPTGRIRLAGDDTVDEHRGKKFYGKARHRDPVRSSHSSTAYRYGHKWVALCILVRLPSPQGRGPCRCWWPCIAPSRTTNGVAAGARRRPS